MERTREQYKSVIQWWISSFMWSFSGLSIIFLSPPTRTDTMTISAARCPTLTHHYQRLQQSEANRKNMHLSGSVIGWNNNSDEEKKKKKKEEGLEREREQEDVSNRQDNGLSKMCLWIREGEEAKSMIDTCTRRNLGEQDVWPFPWQDASNVKLTDGNKTFSLVSTE